MEIPGGHTNMKNVLLAEFLGTAFIMMAINWGGTQDAIAPSVAATYFILY